jgi:hypothetical protein
MDARKNGLKWRSLITSAVVAAVGGLPFQPARAWGDAGHEIVAAIAYSRLQAATRKRVDAMLAADPDKLTPPDFVSRATWADRYRDSDRYSTKQHYLATQQWHFVDIELDGGSVDAACNGHPALPAGKAASAGPAADCVIDKVEQFAAELRDPATAKAERLLALKFLLHFVGDLHQPLHAADHHDRGGNSVPVVYNHITVPSNLHSYWDTRLVQELGTNPRVVGAALAASITAAQAQQWAQGSTTDWANEANALARDVAYNFTGESSAADDHGGTAERLDSVYDQRSLPVVKLQLSRAGVRLAALLNGALK